MAILVIPLFKTGEWPTKQVKRTFGIHHFHPHCGVSEWPSYLQERSNTSATFSSRSSLPPWECRFPCHPSNPFWPPCSCPAPCCSFAGWAFSCWSTCAAVEVAVVKTCWDGICRLLSTLGWAFRQTCRTSVFIKQVTSPFQELRRPFAQAGPGWVARPGWASWPRWTSPRSRNLPWWFVPWGWAMATSILGAWWSWPSKGPEGDQLTLLELGVDLSQLFNTQEMRTECNGEPECKRV